MNTELLMDLEVQITVELGRKKMSLQDVLKTNHGSVLELDTNVGMPLMFYVNNKPFGTCEVVQMANNKLGIKIIELFKKTNLN